MSKKKTKKSSCVNSLLYIYSLVRSYVFVHTYIHPHPGDNVIFSGCTMCFRCCGVDRLCCLPMWSPMISGDMSMSRQGKAIYISQQINAPYPSWRKKPGYMRRNNVYVYIYFHGLRAPGGSDFDFIFKNKKRFNC